MTHEMLAQVETIDGDWIEVVIGETEAEEPLETATVALENVAKEIEGLRKLLDEMDEAIRRFGPYHPVGYCTPYRGRPMTHREYVQVEERYLNWTRPRYATTFTTDSTSDIGLDAMSYTTRFGET